MRHSSVSAITLRGAAAAAFLIFAAPGCSKKKKEEPIFVPPPQGAASADELTTAIGQARGISSALAPSSARWQRVFVLDDKRAILAGETETEAIALVTDTAGRTWRSLRRPRDGWSTWAAGEDGTLVLAAGPRTDPRIANAARSPAEGEALKLFFASPEADELSPPAPVALPTLSRGVKPPIDVVPAVLPAGNAALIIEPKPRNASLLFAGPPGAAPTPVLALPLKERALPVPYGRPPTLLSSRGRDLLVRPIPAPGKPLDAPRSVAGLVMTPAATAALSAAPACDFAGWSLQLVPQSPDSSVVVAISATRTAVLKLPAKVAPGATLGCGADRITVEVIDPTNGEPTIAACSLDGPCVLAEKPPFRPWLEPHERSIVSVPTRDGAAAVLIARTASRWGLYLSQSPDGSKLYDLPRTIGEGTGERGRIDLGALLSFGNRLLMLLQADVTGTPRRGWYVTASEDGGLTWNPP